MEKRLGLRLAAAISLAGALPIAASNHSNAQPVKSNVRFLATSTSVRSSWGGNQDVYLAEVTLRGNSQHSVLAKVVDEYPPGRRGLPSEILTSSGESVLTLRRDLGCDVPFRALPLRTSPGDLRAMLPDHLVFQPALPQLIDDVDVLPCYRTVMR